MNKVLPIRERANNGRGDVFRPLARLAGALFTLLLAVLFWALPAPQAQAQLTASCPAMSPGDLVVYHFTTNTCTLNGADNNPNVIILNNIGDPAFYGTSGFVIGAEPDGGGTEPSNVYFNDGSGDVTVPVVEAASSPEISPCATGATCSVSLYFTYDGTDYEMTFASGSGSDNVGAAPVPSVVTPSDTTPPTVTSVLRQTPASSPTSSDSLVFRVTFNEDVQNVDTADFSVSSTSTASVTGVSGSGSVYDVTVAGGDLASYNGTVGLVVSGSTDIADLASNTLTNTTPTGTVESYTVSNAPEINILGNGTSIVSGDTTPSAADDTDFGVIDVATGSNTNTFTIQNTGAGALNVTSITSSNSGTFAISGATSANISPSGSTTFDVVFDASAAGLHSSTITVNSDDADEGVYTFTVRGTATEAPDFSQSFSPSTVAIGEVSTVTFTLDNSSNSVAATSVDFTDNLPSALQVASPPSASTTCTGGTLTATAGAGTISYAGGTITASTTCTLSVNVTSASNGSFTNVTGNLTSSLGNSGTSSATLTVSSPEIALERPSGTEIASTGTDVLGLKKAGVQEVLTYTVRNSGGATLTLSGPATSSSETNVDVDSISAPGTTTVGAGSTTTFTVAYTPQAAGSFNFDLQLLSDDADEGTYTITVSGTGGTPEIDIQGNSTSIVNGDTTPSVADDTDFGTVDVTGGSNANTFTIRNTGSVPLSLTSVSSSDPTRFAVSGTTSGTIAASGSSTFTVTFDPDTVGTHDATITVVSDDGDEASYTFAVTGTGGTPEIDIQGNSTSIVNGDTTPSVADDTDFGTVDVTGGSNANTFTIRNTGSVPLSLTSVSSSDPTRFAVSGTTSGTIAASGSSTFTVTFDPDTVGTHDATITVVSDDGDEATYTFAVTGIGSIAPGFTQAFAPDEITTGGISTLTYTIVNTGNLVDATGLSFSNLLPTDMEVATPANAGVTCTGGTLTAVSGTSDITYVGGAVAAGASCTVSVDVTAVTSGTYNNISGPLSSSLGTSGASLDSLTATAPEIEVSSSVSGALTDGDSDAQGTVDAAVMQTVVYTITNSGTADLLLDTASASGAVNVTLQTITAPGQTTLAAGDDTTFSVSYTPTLDGSFSFDLSFDNSDADEDPFNFTVSGTASGDPGIAVSSSESGAVADDGTDAVSTPIIEGQGGTITYTMSNPGTDTLNIDTPTLADNIANASNVSVDALTLNSGTVAPAGSTTLVVDFTPTLGGAYSFDLLIESDVPGAEGDYTITVSGSAVARPTVVLSGVPEDYAGDTPFDVTVTFSESVTGFALADVDVTNGTASGLSGAGAVYTVSITPDGNSDVSVSIPENVATASSGAGNFASGTATVINQTAEVTEELIASFMAKRSAQLLSHQPNLRNRIFGTGRSAGGFSFAASDGTMNFDLNSAGGKSTWFSLTGSRSQIDGAEASYLFGAAGSHMWLSDTMAVGAMVQLDRITETNAASRIEGTGWLVGPYLGVRSATQPLFFDTYLLYGQSQNTISPFGTYEDSFSTERLLFSANLSGEIERGSVTLFPTLSLNWTSDRQEAYVDGLGNPIASQTLEIGQLAAGVDFESPLSNGWTLNGGLRGTFSSVKGSGALAESSVEGGRGRIDLGLSHVSASGGVTEVTSFYDGIGRDDYEVYGLGVTYSLRF